ncbi:MFS transporter [Paracoccaceae bacterium]|nr:MFS transporter [Paracoccaceae bacterium]
MAENETRRAITVKLLSGGTWRSLLLAVLLLAVVRRSLELGTLANVDALGGTILTLTLLALINATFGFGLGLAAGSYLTRAKRRAPVLTWACALYGAILCVAALSSSLPVFLLLIGCATGIGVFINAGETMIETGYLDSETEIVTANALRGATLQSLQLIAPLITGTLLALVAPRMLIVIAAITSIIPLLVFARLPLEVRTDEQTGTSATTLPALLPAIRGHVAHDRDLQIFFSVQAIVMIVLGMHGPLIFTYIIKERGFGVPQFAFLMAALGAGALLSAGLFIWTSMRPSLTLIMALLTLDGVALLAFVLMDIPALIFGSMAAMGLIGGVYMIVMRSFLQSRSEVDGRDTLIAAFYGIQEPFLMMGLGFLLLILPFFTASQILLGASLVEIGLSTALLLAAPKNPARL